MFKPMNFRFKHTIFWPGVGPANEIAASNILKVEDEGEDYLFVHASGSAVKVAKSQVTAYGVYDADDVPNLPTEGDYKDGNDADSDDDSKDTDTRCGGNTTPLPTEPKGPEAPVQPDPDTTANAGDNEPANPVNEPESPIDTDSNTGDASDTDADTNEDPESTPVDSGIGSDTSDEVAPDSSDDAPSAPDASSDSPDSPSEPSEAPDTDTPFTEDSLDEGGFGDFTPLAPNVKVRSKSKKRK